MLKRLVRHRIFLVVLALVIVVGGIAAPIRHDYTFDQYPGVACDKDCGYGYQTTQVQYGVPLVWLTLTKTTSVYDKHVVSTKTERDDKKLLLDIAGYGALIMIILGIAKFTKRRSYADFGH
jgi:hypothetical protein